MTPDMIAITPDMIAIIGVGVALLSATLPFNLYLIGQVANLRDRMARIEWLFEGLTGRQPKERREAPRRRDRQRGPHDARRGRGAVRRQAKRKGV